MKVGSTVVSFFALGCVATVVAAASRHEVQHRLRGGVPASSTMKTVKDRRLGYATTSTSSDMDDMDMASNVTDSASTSEDTSEDGVTDGPPNSPTGDSASASASEDTTAASASSADCASISKSSLVGSTFRQYLVHSYTRTIHFMRYSHRYISFCFFPFSVSFFSRSFFHSSCVSLCSLLSHNEIE